jgi:hypothetical protein
MTSNTTGATWVVYGYGQSSIWGGGARWWSRAHVRIFPAFLFSYYSSSTQCGYTWPNATLPRWGFRWESMHNQKVGFPVVYSGVLTGNEVTRRGCLGCAHAQPEVGISRTFSFYFFFVFFLFFFPLFSIITFLTKVFFSDMLCSTPSSLLRPRWIFYYIFRDFDVSWFLPLIFVFIQHLNHYFLDLLQFCHICLRECVIFLLFYLFCSSIVINTVIVTAEPLSRNESGRFGALKSDSTHHFFRNTCTKSGSFRFSQFSGCWLILSVYLLMSFDFPFGRLFGVR